MRGSFAFLAGRQDGIKRKVMILYQIPGVNCRVQSEKQCERDGKEETM